MHRYNKFKEWDTITAPILAVVAVLIWTVYSFKHISPFAASWDEVDFVLALDRFDLLAMQPHFPGYPYFVLGADIIRQFVADPIYAYGVWNVLLTASSAVPIWFIARRMISPYWSLVTVLIVMTSPYLWLQTLRPMSEAAGIALLWWYLLFWWRAMERLTWSSSWNALFFFSLLMGVRLSFIPYGLSLIWLLALLCREWKRHGKRVLPRMLWFTALAGGLQLLWVAGLALSEGGFVGFAQLAAAFTQGHFNQWGGGVASATQLSFAERLFRFAGDNVLWTGMFVYSTALLSAAAALLFAAILRTGAGSAASGSASQRIRWTQLTAAWLSRPPLPLALAMLACAYGAWALLAQNIDKPRHITPLIGLIWLLLLAQFRESASRLAVSSIHDKTSQTALPGANTVRSRRILQYAGALLASVLLLLQAVQGGQLTAQQANEKPAVYQLAEAFTDSKSTRGLILYTWEETRVLDYLHVPIIHRRIETYNYFIADINANPNATILLTDHVLKGFEAQVGSLQGKVKQMASFHSDSLFDPVYSNITVYEWLR